MFTNLLSQITGLWDKDFLLASLLPVLAFLITMILIFAGSIGIDGSVSWVLTLSTGAIAVLSALSLLAIIVFSYVLFGLRQLLLNIWCGQWAYWSRGNSVFSWIMWPLVWPLSQLMRTRQEQAYQVARDNALKAGPLEQIHNGFDAAIRPIYMDAASAQAAPLNVIDQLRDDMAKIVEEIFDELRRDYPVLDDYLWNKLRVAYQQYSGDSLRAVYFLLNRLLVAAEQAERGARLFAQSVFEQEFGEITQVEVTRLGNVMKAYNMYSHSRYGLEGQMFWQRLRFVIDKDFFTIANDRRIIIDFSLAMASLALVAAVCVLIAGPLIDFSFVSWPLFAAGFCLAGTAFYNLAVIAAKSLGETVRASYDLFRHKLIDAFDLPQPADLEAERTLWGEVSELIQFGARVPLHWKTRV